MRSCTVFFVAMWLLAGCTPEVVTDPVAAYKAGKLSFCGNPSSKIEYRPEHFLVPENNFVWDPIVDYHLMRLALRLGLIVLPSAWTVESIERNFTSFEREAAIRKTVFRVVKLVIEKSGRSIAEIDNLMWSARRFCPEMEKPNCGACILQSVCAKKIKLFQPVIRTTAY